jgi:hypothetical protein
LLQQLLELPRQDNEEGDFENESEDVLLTFEVVCKAGERRVNRVREVKPKMSERGKANEMVK